MKKLFLISAVLFSLSEAAFSQVKIIKATNQKVLGGMGGINMNYFIEFKTKAAVEVEVDSVKCIADGSRMEYTFIKNDKGYYVISFSQGLKRPVKCATCRDVDPKQPNPTKGVVIYYKKNKIKPASFKLKKFTQLPDLNMP